MLTAGIQLKSRDLTPKFSQGCKDCRIGERVGSGLGSEVRTQGRLDGESAGTLARGWARNCVKNEKRVKRQKSGK